MLNIPMNQKYDILIVGAGLSGAVIAERFASLNNFKVLVIDKRNHIGGNCYDYIDENGILINKYGAHLFHTDDEEVWTYIQNFTEWVRWDHKVLGVVDEKLINIPVNINTVNVLCNKNIKTEEEMNVWLRNVQVKYDTITNGEEQAKARVGEELYKKIFKNYTFKQWGKYPEEIDASVLARIPIRNNHDERYFTNKYQALPKNGYTKFIEKILSHPNITVKTDTDFETIKNQIDFKTLIYTGPIDSYFSAMGMEKLEYRSIDFIIEHHYNMNFYQTNSVVNYPGAEVPYTRIVEYKHFLNQKSPHTTIVKEITKNVGDPYYPVPNAKNIALYEQYKTLAKSEKNVYFIGRLANYKYFNMDEAIKNSLDFFNQLS
jgi:UDP-galactopyranose mutase